MMEYDRCFLKWGTPKSPKLLVLLILSGENHCEKRCFNFKKHPNWGLDSTIVFFICGKSAEMCFRQGYIGSGHLPSPSCISEHDIHHIFLHGTTWDAWHNFTGEHVIYVAQDEIAYMRQPDIWNCKCLHVLALPWNMCLWHAWLCKTRWPKMFRFFFLICVTCITLQYVLLGYLGVLLI
jgi:hypothetical protein